MKFKYNVLLPVLSVFLIAGILMPVLANDDEDEEYEHRNGKTSKGAPAVIENRAYSEECSSCHYLFNPGLLTERSWDALMKKQAGHFGEDLALDEATISEILGFLKANSADKTNTEWGRKITKSSGQTAFLRITEVPWIVKEHRKISEAVFKRPSIKSRSNCAACHVNAAAGDFEEHSVKIPKN